jgi:glycosyltransferase involved in cell wall biosynthesis
MSQRLPSQSSPSANSTQLPAIDLATPSLSATKPAPRVLYIFDGRLDRPGLSEVCLHQVLALSESGVNVDLVSRGTARLDRVTFRGLRWTPANALSWLPSRMYYPLQMRFFGYMGARMIRRNHYDAVISWKGRALFAFGAAHSRGTPCVLNESLHHWSADSKPSNPVTERWPTISRHEREMEYRLATLILTPSDRSARTFVDHGFDPSKIVSIGRGVDTDRFSPRHEVMTDRPFRMIFCGRACERKGIREVVRAWQLANVPSAELIIVGQVDEEVTDLLATTHRGSIRWLGYRADVAGLMSQCDAQILLSSAEGMAKSLLEGAASGLASLHTSHTGVPLIDGVHGFVVDRSDIDGVARGISLLANDRARCHAMGRAARDLVVREHSWAAFRRRFIDATGAPNSWGTKVRPDPDAA